MNSIQEQEKKFTKRQIIILPLLIGYYSLLIMATTFGRSAEDIYVRTIDFDNTKHIPTSIESIFI